jgi:hypothetical protein
LIGDSLYKMTKTITSGSSSSADMTFGAKVGEYYAKDFGGGVKISKQTTRRLSDNRHLRSNEEMTQRHLSASGGEWDVKYEETANAPGSSFGSSRPSDTNTGNTSMTAAIAAGASVLVVGAMVLVAHFARRQHQQQGSPEQHDVTNPACIEMDEESGSNPKDIIQHQSSTSEI